MGNKRRELGVLLLLACIIGLLAYPMYLKVQREQFIEQRDQLFEEKIAEISVALEENDWEFLNSYGIDDLKGPLQYGFTDDERLIIVEKIEELYPGRVEKENVLQKHTLRFTYGDTIDDIDFYDIDDDDIDLNDIKFTNFPLPKYDSVSLEELFSGDFSSIEGDWLFEGTSVTFSKDGIKLMDNKDVTLDNFASVGPFTVNTKTIGTDVVFCDGYIELYNVTESSGKLSHLGLVLVPKGVLYDGEESEYDRIFVFKNGKVLSKAGYRKEDYNKSIGHSSVWNDDERKQLEQFIMGYKEKKYLENLEKIDLSTTPIGFDEFYESNGLLGIRKGNYRAPHNYFDSSLAVPITVSYSADGQSQSDVTFVDAYRYGENKLFYFAITADGVPNVYRIYEQRDDYIVLNGSTYWDARGQKRPSKDKQVVSAADYQDEFYDYFKELVNKN